MKQIAIDAYNTFYLNYYKSGDNKRQRLGQAFCNAFRITDSELFYLQDAAMASALIFERYINKEESKNG